MDYEFEERANGDNDGWDDIIEQDEICHPFTNKDRLQHPCWRCNKCSIINNLKLTMEKYNFNCYGCSNAKYLPGKTIVFNSNQYDSPKNIYSNNTLVKSNIIKRVKTQKTDSFKGHLYGTNRSQQTETDYKNCVSSWVCYQCFFKNINTNQCQKCTAHQYPDIFGWECPNCHYVHGQNEQQSNNQCHQCQYTKPIKFDHENKYIFVVPGFCNRVKKQYNNYHIEMPDVLMDVIKSYYVLIRTDALQWNANRNRLNGTFITNNFYGIYRWRFKISANAQYVEMGDGGIDIGIGVCSMDECNKNEQFLLRYILNDNSSTTKRYCRRLVNNDIITMELNEIKKTLSFGINNDWYGNFDYIEPHKYQVEIINYDKDVMIKNIDLSVIYNEHLNERNKDIVDVGIGQKFEVGKELDVEMMDEKTMNNDNDIDIFDKWICNTSRDQNIISSPKVNLVKSDECILNGWKKCDSKTYKRSYWFNVLTGQYQWDEPIDSDINPFHNINDNKNTSYSGWNKYLSKTTNKYYWFNKETGECQWTLPYDNNTMNID